MLLLIEKKNKFSGKLNQIIGKFYVNSWKILIKIFEILKENLVKRLGKFR